MMMLLPKCWKSLEIRVEENLKTAEESDKNSPNVDEIKNSISFLSKIKIKFLLKFVFNKMEVI